MYIKIRLRGQRREGVKEGVIMRCFFFLCKAVLCNDQEILSQELAPLPLSSFELLAGMFYAKSVLKKTI
jgi:hypothetical protein